MAGDALSLALFPLRAGLNLASLLAIGLALHAALGIVERNAFKAYRLAACLAAAAVVVFAAARVAVVNAQMGDGTTLFDPDIFALSWLALGPPTVALAAGAAVIAVGFVLSSRLTLTSGSLVLATGFALTGHSQGLEDPGLAPFAVALHVLIAGFWIAAPVTLYPQPSVSDDGLHARLTAFSRIAVAAIPILVIAGIWLAWRLAGGFAPLFSTAYGLLLLLKLAVAGAAMGLGALNKQVITGKVRTNPAVGRRWLRLALAAEASLFLIAVLAISAATTIAGPGESLPLDDLREFPPACV